MPSIPVSYGFCCQSFENCFHHCFWSLRWMLNFGLQYLCGFGIHALVATAAMHCPIFRHCIALLGAIDASAPVHKYLEPVQISSLQILYEYSLKFVLVPTFYLNFLSWIDTKELGCSRCFAKRPLYWCYCGWNCRNFWNNQERWSHNRQKQKRIREIGTNYWDLYCACLCFWKYWSVVLHCRPLGNFAENFEKAKIFTDNTR